MGGGDFWDFFVPVVTAVAAVALGQPEMLGFNEALGTAGSAAIGSGIGSGVKTGVETGDPLSGLASGVLSGAGSYAGNVLGEAVGAQTGGLLDNTITGVATENGLNVGNVLSDVLNQSTIGGLIGSAAGSSLAQNVGADMLGLDFSGQTASPSPSNAGLNFTQLSTKAPVSLPSYSNLTPSQYSGLTPSQQTSSLATQGVYGSGLGEDEQKYFMSLMNNRLVDSSGNLGSLSSINPIERSYLSQLGLNVSDYTNPTDFVSALDKLYAA